MCIYVCMYVCPYVCMYVCCKYVAARRGQTGVRKVQQCSAGRQKVGKTKVKAVKPDSAFVLVYSLGDEMYKWTRASSLLRPFAERVEDVYSFRGCKASARRHLHDMDPSDSDRYSYTYIAIHTAIHIAIRIAMYIYIAICIQIYVELYIELYIYSYTYKYI